MEKVLLLFSGGRDSILSTIRLMRDGYHVRLLGFDNGHMSEVHHIEETANRVIRSIDVAQCSFAGIRNIAPTVCNYMKPYMTTAENIGCPMLHCTCLSCHTAMIVHAIQFAVHDGCIGIATGDKLTDNYLLDVDQVQAFYTELCMIAGLKFLQPVLDVTSNFSRKIEIAEAGIHPKVCEPQCWLGYQPSEESCTDIKSQTALDIFFKEVATIAKIQVQQMLQLET